MFDSVVRVIDALRALDAPEPDRVGAALGVSLTTAESGPGYQRFTAVFPAGVFAEAECGFRPVSRFGWVRLVARRPAPAFSVERLAHLAPLPGFTPGFPNLPERVVCFSYSLRNGAFKIECWCTMDGYELRSVTLSWGPPNPGEEPVFDSAPSVIRLPSYDVHVDVLEYTPQTRKWRVIPRADLAGAPHDFGHFTREGRSVAGVFASPAGPVFFLDEKRFVGEIGTTRGRIERLGTGSRYRYALEHRSMKFDLVYEERHGIGANPYDTTREDVDLFALVVSKISDAAFYRAYTRPWSPSDP